MYIQYLLLLALMLLMPDLAFAEDSMPTKLIYMIGPDLSTGHILSSAKGAAMAVFLGILEAYAAFMICSHTIIGTINTAHEGKVLGSKWHQIWAPMRIITSVTTLVPVMGGYCLAQLALIQGAVASSDAASNIWTAYVETVMLGTSDQSAIQPIGLPNPLRGLDLTFQILKFEVCQKIYMTNVEYDNNGFLAWLPGMPSGSMAGTLPPAAGVSMGQSILWQYGVQCGAMEIRAFDSSKTVRSAQIFTPTAGMIQFMTDRQNAIGKLVESVRDSNIASQIALSQQPGSGQTFPENLISSLKPIAQQYEAEMLVASQKFLVDYDKVLRTKVVSASAHDGWMAAGAYFPALSQASQQMSELAGSVPEFIQPDVADHVWNSSLTRQIAKILELTSMRWKSDSRVDTMTGAELAQFADERSSFISGQLSKILNPVTEYLIHIGDGDMSREMEARVEFGQRLLNTAEALVAARMAVSWAAGNGVGQASGAWAAYQSVAPISDFVLYSLIFNGILNSEYLPMVPQICFLMAVVGWLCFIAEALIGVTVLAAMFANMSGSEFIDSCQRPGMTMILNVGLRAILVVFGFILGPMTLVPIALYITDWLFPMAWISSQGGGIQFVIGLTCAVWIKSLVHYQVIMRGCCIIYELANKVISWIGSSEPGRSEGSNLKETTGNVQSGGSSSVSKLQSTSSNVEKGLSA